MQPQSFGIGGDKTSNSATGVAGGSPGESRKPGAPKPASTQETVSRPKASSLEPAKPVDSPSKAATAATAATQPAKSADEPAKAAAEPAKAVAEPAKTAQAPAESARPKTADPKTPSDAPAKTAAAPAAQPDTDSARRLIDPAAAAQWIRELAPGSFVIWHAVFPGYDAALAFRKNHRALERSVIVSIWRNGQNAPLFAVISAPFASAAQAYAALRSDAYPPNNWVRSARDVQAELTSQNAVARRN
jgi:hypothetical protein